MSWVEQPRRLFASDLTDPTDLTDSTYSTDPTPPASFSPTDRAH